MDWSQCNVFKKFNVGPMTSLATVLEQSCVQVDETVIQPFCHFTEVHMKTFGAIFFLAHFGWTEWNVLERRS